MTLSQQGIKISEKNREAHYEQAAIELQNGEEV